MRKGPIDPGPVPKEYTVTPSPKRTCKPKDRFMADVRHHEFQ